MRWLIDGCYGDGNTGDEALLRVVLLLIREHDPNAHIEVFSSNPGETQIVHGVHAIEQCNPFGMHIYGSVRHGLLAKAVGAIRSCDNFVLGGGELFRDDCGWRACAGMMYRLAIAHLLRKTTIALGVGVQFNRTGSIASRIIKAGLRATELAYCRDASSAALFDRYSRKAKLAVWGPDLVFGGGSRQQVASYDNGNRLSIGIALKGHALKRAASSEKQQLLQQLADTISLVASTRELEITIIPLCPSDVSVSQELADGLKRVGCTLDLSVCSSDYDSVIRLVQSQDLMFAMPLHASILAISAGIPSIGLSYDKKVTHLFQQCRLEQWCIDWKVVNSSSLTAMAAAILDDLSSAKQAVARIRSRNWDEVRTLTAALLPIANEVTQPSLEVVQ